MVVYMRGLRRKEKAIEDKGEMVRIIKGAKYVTVAMCAEGEPYLVTLSHGYDDEKEAIYFHCAREGKKVDILRANDVVWGQALEDGGYVAGECDHLYATTQFRGRVTFVEEPDEKRHALAVMITQLEESPDEVIDRQVTDESVARVNIGRIDIDHMSGKRSERVVVSL